MPKRMIRRGFVLAVLISLTGLQVGHADSSTPEPPEAVFGFATPSLGKMTLVWLPPTDGPVDGYRVYGYSGGVEYLLTSPEVTVASVASGYQSYAVTAVRDGVQSPPGPMVGCLDIDPAEIPPIQPSLDCL